MASTSEQSQQVNQFNITGSQTEPVALGGILQLKGLKALQREQEEQAQLQNNSAPIQQLAGYIKQKWYYARYAKEYTAEQLMLRNVRARRGEYDPDKFAQLKEQGSTTIYMFLTSNKCRAASSWLRDVLLTGSDDKPWTIKPNPIPELEPDILAQLMVQAQQQLEQILASGAQPTDLEVRQLLLQMKDAAYRELTDIAEETAMRMERKMHSQLLEGKWTKAFAQFIDDLVTFPSAVLKGPIVRNKPMMKWVKTNDPQQPYDLKVEHVLSMEWERVSPFNIYPAPDASEINDGYLIERHKMSRQDLLDLIGVEGYSDGAIRQVLDIYGKGGLRDWIYVDLTRATAEGKSTVAVGQNPSELIDALQFWGSVQGKMLKDWGISPEDIPDDLAEYPIEAWLIGSWVIKAVINPDPLGRKPYYKASYEEVPGAFWGNSVADLCRDVQSICNAAARALVNNMSLASGPQTVVNVDRLPAGENITQIFPWKVWQVTNDPLAGGAQPVTFFQPNSQAQELMAVYDKFSTLADEYTGIPKYLAGGSSGSGAGRTASGLSMLMTNAGKSIKQVIANIDEHVIKPSINRLYYMNMRYNDDPDLKGDVNIVARGAASLVEKEAAAQRRNEFLGVALNNPVAQQIVGIEGIAELLRQTAGTLDLNVDKIVPDRANMARKIAEMQQMQQQTAIAQQGAPQGTPPAPPGGQQLMNGEPVVNTVS